MRTDGPIAGERGRVIGLGEEAEQSRPRPRDNSSVDPGAQFPGEAVLPRSNHNHPENLVKRQRTPVKSQRSRVTRETTGDSTNRKSDADPGSKHVETIPNSDPRQGRCRMHYFDDRNQSSEEWIHNQIPPPHFGRTIGGKKLVQLNNGWTQCHRSWMRQTAQPI
jgi:hypothetical protein